MNKLSLDNPFVPAILMLFIGLLGFVLIQIETNSLNSFSILFLILSSALLIFYFKLSAIIDNGRTWNIKSINTPFALVLIITKVYFIFLLISSGGSETFEGRLDVYGNSFLFGINYAFGLFLFPIIPLTAKSIFLRHFSFYVFIFSFVVNLLLAPSKSIFIGLIFSLLSYRFLKRKMGSNLPVINLFSLRSVVIFLAMLVLTLLLLYLKSGNNFLDLLLYRIMMNFDNAVFASQIPDSKTPEHTILFYAFLPLFKRFNPELYDLEYFNIPQWVLSETLGISRYGRSGFPNDNFIVGAILSYRLFSVVVFIFVIILVYIFVKRLNKRRRISPFDIYLLLSIPTFFASTQEFAIMFFTSFLTYYFFEFIFLPMPKKRIHKFENHI